MAVGFTPLIQHNRFGSELAVTAMADNTQVTIVSRADTNGSGGAPAFLTGIPKTIALDAGDVIEISSVTGDLTGSLVTSDQPVQVVSGHQCANVPIEIGPCDHLEESMFPLDSLGTIYVISAPLVPELPGGKSQIVRIIATEPSTAISYDPPQAGAALVIANSGDFIELPPSAASYVIHASARVMVAQYMEGFLAGGNDGDPSLVLTVPASRYRLTYLFKTPIDFESTFVDITGPVGTAVTVDGQVVELSMIDGTGYGEAHVQIGSGTDGTGTHLATGTDRFGMSVYGNGNATSYWFPAGIDLANSIVE